MIEKITKRMNALKLGTVHYGCMGDWSYWTNGCFALKVLSFIGAKPNEYIDKIDNLIMEISKNERIATIDIPLSTDSLIKSSVPVSVAEIKIYDTTKKIIDFKYLYLLSFISSIVKNKIYDIFMNDVIVLFKSNNVNFLVAKIQC